MDSWIMTLISPNHYTRRGQNLSVLTDLAWNEKRPSLISLHFLKNYILCSPILSLVKYFLSKKKTWLGSHPTLGANEKYFRDTGKINGSKKSLEQKSNVWERVRRRKSIDWGPSKKNFEEGYAKNGKKMPINSKRGKTIFDWEKTINAKSQH